MHLLLIMPCAKRISAKNSARVKMAPLGLAVIASLTPAEWEITIIDELVEDIDFSVQADLVGISSFTSGIERAYEIADIYRKKGIPVVMGGFHPSAMPNEALQHCDAVVIGEAEIIWGKVLEDFKNNQMQGIYKADEFHNMKGLPYPRLDLLKHQDQYSISQYIQTTRGCPYNCEFCSTSPHWGTKYRCRPVDEVIEELKRFDRKKVVFMMDDDIAAIPARAKELFRKMIPLKLKWISQCGVGIGRDEELLDLARQSGCICLFIGFESPNAESIGSVAKKQNNPNHYKDIINKVRAHKIAIQGAFVAGFDGDTANVFKVLDRFITESRLDAFQVNVLYPYPGTRIRNRIIAEQRLTSNDWGNYMLDGINYIPVNMTQEELNEGYRWILKKHTTLWAIFKKSFRALIELGFYPGLTSLVLNLGTRRSYKQILLNPNPIRKEIVGVHPIQIEKKDKYQTTFRQSPSTINEMEG